MTSASHYLLAVLRRFGFISSRRFFSFTNKYVLIAPITITTPTIAQTKLTIESTTEPLWLLAVFLFMTCLLAVVIFHWVLVPLVKWLSDKFSA